MVRLVQVFVSVASDIRHWQPDARQDTFLRRLVETPYAHNSITGKANGLWKDAMHLSGWLRSRGSEFQLQRIRRTHRNEGNLYGTRSNFWSQGLESGACNKEKGERLLFGNLTSATGDSH